MPKGSTDTQNQFLSAKRMPAPDGRSKEVMTEQKQPPFMASFHRVTGETNVSLTLNLHGSGQVELDFPVPFLRHMLHLFAVHGRFDLRIQATGDVDVDDHHYYDRPRKRRQWDHRNNTFRGNEQSHGQTLFFQILRCQSSHRFVSSSQVCRCYNDCLHNNNAHHHHG